MWIKDLSHKSEIRFQGFLTDFLTRVNRQELEGKYFMYQLLLFLLDGQERKCLLVSDKKTKSEIPRKKNKKLPNYENKVFIKFSMLYCCCCCCC